MPATPAPTVTNRWPRSPPRSAIKAAGVVVYTVGFNIYGNQSAQDIVEQCATDPAHVFLPIGGGALKCAFRAIAVGIKDLRIAR